MPCRPGLVTTPVLSHILLLLVVLLVWSRISVNILILGSKRWNPRSSKCDVGDSSIWDKVCGIARYWCPPNLLYSCRLSCQRLESCSYSWCVDRRVGEGQGVSVLLDLLLGAGCHSYCIPHTFSTTCQSSYKLSPEAKKAPKKKKPAAKKAAPKKAAAKKVRHGSTGWDSPRCTHPPTPHPRSLATHRPRRRRRLLPRRLPSPRPRPPPRPKRQPPRR